MVTTAEVRGPTANGAVATTFTEPGRPPNTVRMATPLNATAVPGNDNDPEPDCWVNDTSTDESGPDDTTALFVSRIVAVNVTGSFVASDDTLADRVTWVPPGPTTTTSVSTVGT